MACGRPASLVVAAALLAAAGSPGTVAAGGIVVSCAASLQDVVAAAARAWGEGEAHVNAGASNLLARQIAEGAPVDLFLSADERTIDDLRAKGFIDPASVVILAANRVVAVCPSDRVLPVRAPADLAGPQVRSLALPDSAVPIGRYAAAFLRRAGILASLGDRVVRTENVRASLAAVASGAADMAFVYATDARTTKQVTVVWEVPPEMIPPVRIVGGVVKRPGAAAEAASSFLRFLAGAPGQRILRDAGFEPVADVPR